MGSIRPILVGDGLRKIATWNNADDEHVLLKVSRLADAKKCF